MAQGMLERETLVDLVEQGAVDTVVVAFPDLQGRLVGKRVTGRFFVDHVLDEGIEACNYLLAVDVDMEPLPGYRYTSWEQGYGDFRAVPDLSSLRGIPWLEGTALVLCDLVEHSGAPVAVAPRTILRHQVERAAAMGLRVKLGAEAEFFLFRESYDEAADQGYRGLTPHAPYVEDYHVLQTTKDEYLIREIRNGMETAGVPVEFSKGEAARGQHEINLRYADALEMADRHVIYKNGAKEIAHRHGRSISFMAKWAMDEPGCSCHVHSSVWDAEGEASLMWGDDPPLHLGETGLHFLGGLLGAARELTWMMAPTINSYKRFEPGSWAPTTLVWGLDNRTCAFRVVGEGPGRRVECRVPGADANPYLAFAATIAAGLWGIEHRIDPPPPFDGNAYEATDAPRVPWNIVEAADELERSEIAAKAFGDDVHHHLVNTARQEWARFHQAVTDWERRRGFEQA